MAVRKVSIEVCRSVMTPTSSAASAVASADASRAALAVCNLVCRSLYLGSLGGKAVQSLREVVDLGLLTGALVVRLDALAVTSEFLLDKLCALLPQCNLEIMDPALGHGPEVIDPHCKPCPSQMVGEERHGCRRIRADGETGERPLRCQQRQQGWHGAGDGARHGHGEELRPRGSGLRRGSFQHRLGGGGEFLEPTYDFAVSGVGGGEIGGSSEQQRGFLVIDETIDLVGDRLHGLLERPPGERRTEERLLALNGGGARGDLAEVGY